MPRSFATSDSGIQDLSAIRLHVIASEPGKGGQAILGGIWLGHEVVCLLIMEAKIEIKPKIMPGMMPR